MCQVLPDPCNAKARPSGGSNYNLPVDDVGVPPEVRTGVFFQVTNPRLTYVTMHAATATLMPTLLVEEGEEGGGFTRNCKVGSYQRLFIPLRVLTSSNARLNRRHDE